MSKHEHVAVGQRWIHSGTPGVIHVVSKIGQGRLDTCVWADFEAGRGCMPIRVLMDSVEWQIEEPQ